MSRIHILDEDTIKQIAAGEVVERPASVIKEVIENSIDAEAKKILVRVDTNDFFSISIEDDGYGINKDDIEKVFINHATSKILKFKDLESLNTMGFRGEALSSISAVSESIELTTLSKEKQEGAKALFSSGKLEISDFKKATNGTTISIINLFKNIPARQKFLKSKNTEVRNIIETFINTSLIFIDIHFELSIDNKNVLKLPKTKNLRDRINDAFGKEISNKLIEINYQYENFEVIGYVGLPEIFTQSKKIQYFYINNRFVKSQTINSAIKKASAGLAHRDLNPLFFLNLKTNPSSFDINVHPRKTEVKFENEQEIFLTIYKLIKQKLLNGLNPLNVNTSDKNNFNFLKVSNGPKNTPYAQKSTDMLQINSDTNSNKNLSIRRSSNAIDKGIELNRLLLENMDYGNKHANNNSFVSEDKIEYTSNKPTVNKAIQIMQTYILFEFESELYIADQHAAAEKINFDKLVSNIGLINKKDLLVAHIHEFKNKFEMDAFMSQIHEFEQLGFEISEAGNNTIKVDSVPLIGEINDINSLIESSLNPVENDFDLSYIDLNNLKMSKSLYLKIATIACHSSLRAGQSLSNTEATELANSIVNLHGPLTCPHGRPLLVKYNENDLKKIFRRNL